MRIISVLIIVFLFAGCFGDRTKKSVNTDVYNSKEISVQFDSKSRIITFTKNGNPITGAVMKNMKDGYKSSWQVENGLGTKQTVYYRNGNVERILEMKNGIEHGMFVMFYSNGKKYVEQSYDNGKPVGTWHRWNKEGELVETIEH